MPDDYLSSILSISVKDLEKILRSVISVCNDRLEISLVSCRDHDGDLKAVIRGIDIEENGSFQNIVEVEHLVVPANQRNRRKRIENFIKAWGEVFKECTSNDKLTAMAVQNAFNPCALARTKLYSYEAFRKLLNTEKYLQGMKGWGV